LRAPPRALSDLPAETLSLLAAYDWPGNVRELRNTMARIVLFPELVRELLGEKQGAPPLAAQPEGRRAQARAKAREGGREAAEPEEKRLGRLLDLTLPEAREIALSDLERIYVTIKLRQHGGNVSRAAEAMGVSRQLVHRLMERHGLRGK
jgi:DNA-binding NtrC family response regulator